MMAAQLQEASGAGANPASSRDGGSAQDGQTSANTDASNLGTVPLTNRCGDATSPYVQALATSLVHWQLLNDETIQRAKTKNKMIFMHIGFLACHYCRLLRQDSFLHPSIAAVLNESFIPVVVDREERSDIDAVYWQYLQLAQQEAGRPVNMFLTPELEPIYGGIYWTGPGSETRTVDGRRDSEEQSGFLEVLLRLKKTWEEKEVPCRAEAQEALVKLRKYAAEGTLGSRGMDAPARVSAATTTTVVTESDEHGINTRTTDSLDLDLDHLDEALSKMYWNWDAQNGGFGFGPKFVTAPKFSFLLSLAHFPKPVEDVIGEKDLANATLMALTTLRKIRDGGVHDHAGAGFMRTSKTEDWSFPHFEKMVIDNALLLSLYLDAWLHISEGTPKKEGEFADVVYELANYLTSAPICRDNGGFATSEAADSLARKGGRHMQEGAYYVWTRNEFETVVGGEGSKADVARMYWNVLDYGNVRENDDVSDEFISQNILYVTTEPERLGSQLGMPPNEIKAIAQEARQKLAAHRLKERVRPPIDEKIVTSYNGLVISALARTGAALKYGDVDQESGRKYIATAARAASFIQKELWDLQEKVLYRIYHNGRGNTRGLADDYAYLIQGLLDLYEATAKRTWLDWANELQKRQIELFYDHSDDTSRLVALTARQSENGGFYNSEAAAPHTILALKDGMDTEQPSTNGISVSNLFRLGDMFSDEHYKHLARETLSAFEVEMLQHHWLYPTLLSGVVDARLGSSVTVIADPKTEGDAEKMRNYFTTPRAGSRSLIFPGEVDASDTE